MDCPICHASEGSHYPHCPAWIDAAERIPAAERVICHECKQVTGVRSHSENGGPAVRFYLFHFAEGDTACPQSWERLPPSAP